MSQVEAAGSAAARESRSDAEGLKRPWWQRRSALWLIAAAVILPFGWILPMVHVAWIRARERCGRNS